MRRNMSKITISLMFFLSVIVFMGSFNIADSCDVVVSPPGVSPCAISSTDDYSTTIQGAVNIVNAYQGFGWTINVCPGGYIENVYIQEWKSLLIHSISGNPYDTIVLSAVGDKHVFNISNSPNIRISGLTITGTVPGQMCGDDLCSGVYVRSASVGLSNNYITGNNAGVTYRDTSNFNISNNNIISNSRGINLINVNGITINDNYISYNNEGIGLDNTSYNNNIYHNEIIGNNIQAIDNNLCSNSWYDPTLLEGNSWSDYTGVDDGSGTGKHAIAGDGIGDTLIPHPSACYDDYPQVNPAPVPDITVTPTSIDFGSVNNGSCSDEIVTVTNDGAVDLIIGTVTQPSAPFSKISDDCSGSTLAFSEFCLITYRFCPASAGSFNSASDIPSNDTDENPVTVSMSGTGTNLPPVADPNGPYTGTEGQLLCLDGSGSYDPDGTIVLYEWDIDNDGAFDYSSSSSTQCHTYSQTGTYTIKLRVTDDLGATDEAITTADISDASPTADFSVTPPTRGTAPLRVYFSDESSSYDPIVQWEWDFDSDGNIDSYDQNPSYTYTLPGIYTVTLTVRDSDSSTDSEIKTDFITVNFPSGSINAIDENGCTGQHTSIDTDSQGYVHISYYDCTNGDLKYATNKDIAPGTGNCTNMDFNCQTVDSTGDVGQYTDIAVDSSGSVHISYYDLTNTNVKYATNKGVTPGSGTCASTDFNCETVDNAAVYSSIAVDSSDNAHISYTDPGYAYLMYATNSTGTWVPLPVWYGEDLWGNSSSIAIDSSGYIHISVVKNCIDTFNGLMYVTNTSGSWNVESITSTPFYGWNTNIAIDSSDKAHISYANNDFDLRYATNRGVTPGSGNCYNNPDWNCETVADNVGSDSMDTDKSGNVHISYYDLTNQDLKYATNRGVTPGTGSCASTNFDCETVDSAGDVGMYNSIAVDMAGKVHFSYYDFANEDLKYATKPGIAGVNPVPWYDWVYHAHGDASYWGIFGSGSDSDDKYSPPLPLPISASASVYKEPPGLQRGSADSAITASGMNVATSVLDSANRGENTSQTSANGKGEFSGSFIATHDLFQFSYAFDYSIGANCSYYDDPAYWSYNSGIAWLKVTDLTGSVTLIDETFVNVAGGCYMAGSYYDSGSGSDVISVPVTVEHDIKVEFGIDGDSSASGCSADGGTNLTLQYYTALSCIDPPVLNPRTGKYYYSLQAAYDEAEDGDIIMSQFDSITEDLYADRNISVTLAGGYNCDHSAITGNTVLNGTMTVFDGRVTIGGFILGN